MSFSGQLSRASESTKGLFDPGANVGPEIMRLPLFLLWKPDQRLPC